MTEYHVRVPIKLRPQTVQNAIKILTAHLALSAIRVMAGTLREKLLSATLKHSGGVPQLNIETMSIESWVWYVQAYWW